MVKLRSGKIYQIIRLQRNGVSCPIVNLMYRKLPQELVDLIEYWMYEMAFCPGVITLRDRSCPPQVSGTSSTASEPHLSTQKSTARPTLLALSKSIHRTYQERLWRDNLFVIGGGIDSVDFLTEATEEKTRLAHKGFQQVQKVSLMLSYRDVQWLCLSETYFAAEYEMLAAKRLPLKAFNRTADGWWSWMLQRPGVTDHYCYTKTTRDHHRQLRDHVVSHLTKVWLSKVDYFAGLRVTELTLDLRECYAPAGAFLGRGAAYEFLHSLLEQQTLDDAAVILDKLKFFFILPQVKLERFRPYSTGVIRLKDGEITNIWSPERFTLGKAKVCEGFVAAGDSWDMSLSTFVEWLY
ncbi:MAG: hypothetical protein L6R40_008473 [Gallowayella cf. fulva]|nr:MAG: hypothetical protein L6R40_008473 [Xanthomendoza cf. fulva]